MTPEQITAFFGGLVMLIGAFGTLIVKLNGIHKLVNDKMDKALATIAKQAITIATLTGSEGDKALAEKAITDAVKATC